MTLQVLASSKLRWEQFRSPHAEKFREPCNIRWMQIFLIFPRLCSRPLNMRRKACLRNAALGNIGSVYPSKALQVFASPKLLWEHFRSPQVEKFLVSLIAFARSFPLCVRRLASSMPLWEISHPSYPLMALQVLASSKPRWAQFCSPHVERFIGKRATRA